MYAIRTEDWQLLQAVKQAGVTVDDLQGMDLAPLPVDLWGDDEHFSAAQGLLEE